MNIIIIAPGSNGPEVGITLETVMHAGALYTAEIGYFLSRRRTLHPHSVSITRISDKRRVPGAVRAGLLKHAEEQVRAWLDSHPDEVAAAFTQSEVIKTARLREAAVAAKHAHVAAKAEVERTWQAYMVALGELTDDARTRFLMEEP